MTLGLLVRYGKSAYLEKRCYTAKIAHDTAYLVLNTAKIPHYTAKTCLYTAKPSLDTAKIPTLTAKLNHAPKADFNINNGL